MSSIWTNAPAGGAGGSYSGRAMPAAAQGLIPWSGTSGAMAGSRSAVSQAGKASYATAATQSSSPTDSGSTSDASTSISANDFLTLLVTEMQNQDPTSDMDPNEYINQLTEINSLEQLISINQNLQTALGDTSTPSGSSTGDTSASSLKPAARQSISADSLYPGHGTKSAQTRSQVQGVPSSGVASGNLSSPRINEAAVRVGHALSERSQGVARPALRDIPTRALP